MLRIGWQKTQAKLVAQNRVRKSVESGGEHGPSYILQVWDYMVEVPSADGQPTRIVIRIKNPHLDLPELGGTVPVLVNRRRTKAAFDNSDPSIPTTRGASSASSETRRRPRRRRRSSTRSSPSVNERRRSGR